MNRSTARERSPRAGGALSLRVPAERRERGCARLLERGHLRQLAQRLADPPSQLLAHPVHGRDQAARVGRGFAHGGEDLAVLGPYELRGHHVGGGEPGQAAGDERLHPLAQGDLARQGILKGHVGRSPHQLKRGAHLSRGHDPDDRRLREVGPQCLGHSRGEGRVAAGAVGEVGHEEPIAESQRPGCEQ